MPIPHIVITPDTIYQDAGAIEHTLSRAAVAGPGDTCRSKQMLLITDLETMTAVYQVRHNGAHVTTTRWVQAACAAYNAIAL